MTAYEILGLKEGASQAEIKGAYKALSKIYHPDVNQASNAATIFRLVKQAYEELSITQGEEEKNEESSLREYSPEEVEEIIKSSHLIQNGILRTILKLPAYLLSFVLWLSTIIITFLGGWIKIIANLLFVICVINTFVDLWNKAAPDFLTLAIVTGTMVVFNFLLESLIGALIFIKRWICEVVQ